MLSLKKKQTNKQNKTKTYYWTTLYMHLLACDILKYYWIIVIQLTLIPAGIVYREMSWKWRFATVNLVFRDIILIVTKWQNSRGSNLSAFTIIKPSLNVQGDSVGA